MDDQIRGFLRDVEQGGEMLLDIEARIGELAEKEKKTPVIGKGAGRGPVSSGEPLKHERLGIPEKRMKQAGSIHRHPDVVENLHDACAGRDALCKKHELRVTGCSRQTSLLREEICQECLAEAAVQAARRKERLDEATRNFTCEPTREFRRTLVRKRPVRKTRPSYGQKKFSDNRLLDQRGA
jgi:hypothetical protein